MNNIPNWKSIGRNLLPLEKIKEYLEKGHKWDVFRNVKENTFLIQSLSTNGFEVAILLIPLFGCLKAIDQQLIQIQKKKEESNNNNNSTSSSSMKKKKTERNQKDITSFPDALVKAKKFERVDFLDPGMDIPLLGIELDPNGPEEQLHDPCPRRTRRSVDPTYGSLPRRVEISGKQLLVESHSAMNLAKMKKFRGQFKLNLNGNELSILEFEEKEMENYRRIFKSSEFLAVFKLIWRVSWRDKNSTARKRF